MEEEPRGLEMIDEYGDNQILYLKLQANVIGENSGINFDQNPGEEADYESMSIHEILKRNKVEIFNNEDTQPLFNQVVINNKHFKLYLARNSTLQNCSLMVLNDVDRKKKTFGKLLENLARLDQVNSNFVLKLKGANAFANKVYLLFDLVLMNYSAKKKQVESNNNFKFCVLFYLIEMLSALHEQTIILEDLRFSLLLLDNIDELKFMVPFGINIKSNNSIYFITSA